jgi:hypothetical protein
MDKEQLIQLQWLLDFINEDLNSLSEGRKLKLVTDMALTIGFPSELGSMLPGSGSGFLDTTLRSHIAKLPSYQDIVRYLFLKILEKIDALRHDASKLEERDMSVDESITLRSLAQRKAGIDMLLEINVKETTKFTLGAKGDEMLCKRWASGALERSSLRLHIWPSKEAEALEYLFLKLLDGLPLWGLRQCPECKKRFVHASERERVFCSSKCAAKKASSERYQKIKAESPQLYSEERKKGAERARKSYEGKKRSELGERVKIPHRARKVEMKED